MTEVLGAAADSLLWVPVHLGWGGVTAVIFAVWMTCFCTAGALRDWRIRRACRIPAAPDNQPGTDSTDLRECLHIARQPYTRKENRP